MTKKMDRNSMFDNYESEFLEILSNVQSELEGNLNRLRGEQKKIALKAIEKDLNESDELVDQMEIEITNLRGPEKMQLIPKVRRYKARVAGLKKSLSEVVHRMGGIDSSREELFGSGGWNRSRQYEDYSDDDGYDQRARLLAGTEVIEQGGRRIQDSHRIAIETEAVGANILNDLRLQREQIQHTRSTLLEADAHIDSSQRVLKTMIRRMAASKMVYYAAIIITICLILLILYLKLSK